MPGHGFTRPCVVVFLFSLVRGERYLFVLLILMEMLTITV